MGGDQVSKEIVRIEREVVELKREFKNLQAKAQVHLYYVLLFL
jgi:hypothetical protein